MNDEKIILGGDFIRHIGTQERGDDTVHGGYGYGVRNESGEHLLEFAFAHER